MFKGFNLKDSSVDNITFTLMKNINEIYAEIPKEYVKLISYKFQDTSEMTIEIPNKRFINGIVKDERLYDLILGKHQQIIVNISEKKERFIVTQCTRTEEVYKGDNGEKINYKIKKLTCKSYEYTLIDKKFICEDLSRQLYYDPYTTIGSEDISDGYLNFLEQDTYWKIAHVSDLAKKEYTQLNSKSTLWVGDKTILNMSKGAILWEKDVEINPQGESVIDLSILYPNIKTYGVNNNILIDSKKTHNTNLKSIYTGIKHIKAVYDGNNEYRYAIHYIITLTNNDIIDRWEDLNLFLDNQKVVLKSIEINYTCGVISEVSVYKNRSLEQGTYSYLDLLRQTLSTAFDVVILFDTYNMEVSVYDRSEVGENRGMEISFDTFIKSINKKDQYDNIVNKLYVSSDKTSIIDENPFGTEYILDYSYHAEAGLMSDKLKNAWNRYVIHVESIQGDLFELRLNKNTLNKKIIRDQAENTALDLAIRDLGLSRVDYIKENDTNAIVEVSAKINTKQDRFATLLTNIQISKDSIKVIDDQIKAILKDISLEGATDNLGLIFNSSLLSELDTITIELELNDDFYSTSFGLYNYAKGELTKRNKLAIEFEITTVGLLQKMTIPKGMHWNDYLKMGNFVPLVTGDNDILSDDERGLRIIEFDYIPCDFDSSKFTLSNNDKKDDDSKNASNIGHAVNRNTSYINNYKTTLANSVSVNDYVDSMLYGDGMDLKATAIRSRSERVVYDQTEAGMYVIDGDDSNKQIYIGASMICFTDDRWITVKTALSDKGLVGKEIIGELILGKQLYITSSKADGTISNEFYIGNINKTTHEPDSTGTNFGVRIAENGIERIMLGIEEDIDGIRRARLRLTGKDGSVCLDETGILQRDSSTTWGNTSPNFPVETYIDLDSGVSKISKATLKLRLGQYRGFTKSVTTSSTTTTSGASSNETSGASSNTTSGSSSNTTTSTEDNHKHVIWQHSDWTVADIDAGGTGVYYLAPENTMGGNQAVVTLSIGTRNSNGEESMPGNLYTFSANGGHSHSLYHTHEMGHYHQNPHTHSLNLNLNTQVETGIKLFEMASNVSIKINGQTIMQNINSNMEIDITAYLALNTDNKIEIHSATNGYIGLSTMCKYFSRF